MNLNYEHKLDRNINNNNALKLNNSQVNQNNSQNININPYLYDKKQRRIIIYKLGLNTFLSLLLVVLFFVIPYTYSDKWKVFFFMTLWSFTMNSFYIVSITVIDWIRFCKNNDSSCLKYNDFVRNKYLRICFPFSLSIVFLYWLLILLGDEFEYRGRDVSDTAVGLFFHGIILIFLLFDIFTSRHKNLKNYFLDILILNILIAAYFLLLGIGKYIIKYEPYDFMEMASVRQIVGACILIYISIFDGYVILNLLGNKFFDNNFYDKILINSNYNSYAETEPIKGNIIEKYNLTNLVKNNKFKIEKEKIINNNNTTDESWGTIN